MYVGMFGQINKHIYVHMSAQNSEDNLELLALVTMFNAVSSSSFSHTWYTRVNQVCIIFNLMLTALIYFHTLGLRERKQTYLRTRALCIKFNADCINI